MSVSLHGHPHRSSLADAAWMTLVIGLAGGCYAPNPAFVGRAGGDAPVDLAAPVDVALPVEPVQTDGAVPVDQAPPDLAPAPGDATVDRPVAVAAGGASMSFGGTGGDRYQDTCGADEALIGYRGKQHIISTNSSYIVTLQAVCGRLRVPAGATAVDVTQSTVLPVRGLDRDSPWQVMCPDDQVMVGFEARMDDDDGTIQHFRFQCVILNAAASPAGVINTSSFTMLPWTGNASGTLLSTSCPAGQIGRGHIARVGSFIDAYQMTCGTPSVSP